MKRINPSILFSLVFLVFQTAVFGQETTNSQLRFPAIKGGIRMGTGESKDIKLFFLRYYPKSFKAQSVVQTFTISHTAIMPYDGDEGKGFSLETGALFNMQADMLLNFHFHPCIGLSAGNESWYKDKRGHYITLVTAATVGLGINLWRFEGNVDVGLMSYGRDILMGGEVSFSYIFSKSRLFLGYRRDK